MAVLLVSLAPLRMGRIVAIMGINALAGMAVLTLINLLSGFTQLFVPLNGITVAVSGVLGAPGVVALAVLAAL